MVFYKIAKLGDTKFITERLKSIGYNARVFPLYEKGLYHKDFRKIEIKNNGSLANQIQSAKKLREEKFNWW